MKRSFLGTFAALALAAPLLTSCGGGGDAQGAKDTAFSVYPDKVTITGGTGACPSDGTTTSALFAAEVKVLGGAAPYRESTGFPDLIFVDKTTVQHEGDTFQVAFLSGACIDPGPVIVTDSLNRAVTFTLTTKAGS